MQTRAQVALFSLVCAFGAGVLITLHCVEADAQERIHAARRAALKCIPDDELIIATPTPRAGQGSRT